MAAQEHTFDLLPENVTIFGRTLTIAGALWLGYSGSGVAFRTSAGLVKADVLGVSTTNAATDFAYIGIFIDDNPQMVKRFEVRRDLHTYELYQNHDGNVHTIRLVKLTETRYDKAALSCIRADGEIMPAPAYDPKQELSAAHSSGSPTARGKESAEAGPLHRILFIGDSLTAGYGLLGEHSLTDDPEAYIFTTRQEDVTKSFAWQCAQAFHADAQYFCWSGNGIISHYVRPDSEVPVTDQLMPTLLPYVDKEMETVARIYLKAHGWKDPSGEYGSGLTMLNDRRAASFVPDVVVCNLGTNDASFTRGIPVREQHFVQKYLEMLHEVERFYPDAQILLAYGMVETSLSQACRQVAFLGDYSYLQLPQMDPATEGIGGGGHPGIATHRLCAEVLAGRIRELMGWEWQSR